MDEGKHWSETEEGKKSFMDLINKKYLFDAQGNIYCRECKNETVACVCMGEDESG